MDYTGPSGFLIGNESKGFSDKAADLADAYVRIPMCGQVDVFKCGGCFGDPDV